MEKTLDLYKDRKPYSVWLEVKGKKRKFLIPTELTIEESERLLEIEILIDKSKQEEITNKEDEKIKLNRHFDLIFQYVNILFEHYQPELSVDKIKSMMTIQELLRVFKFFNNERFMHILGLDDSDDTESKKKMITAEKRLESLRQSMTFLITSGFGLLEIRKLYLDEFLQFYSSLIYVKEKKGEMKEGTYESMQNRKMDDVTSLKKQLFKIK